MNRLLVLVSCLGLVSLVAGCTSNRMLIIGPQQQQMNSRLMALRSAVLPCKLTDDQKVKYSMLIPVLRAAKVPIPQAAKDARVDGCASVEFQLDKNGKATNLNTLKESPAGYGFADTLRHRIKMEEYKPSAYPGQWYVLTEVFVTSTMIGPKPGSEE